MLFIADEGGGKYGVMASMDSVYEIIDLSDDLHVLAAYDTATAFDFCGTLIDSLDGFVSDNPVLKPRGGEGCVVDVYVAYLNDAEEMVASIEQRAKLEIAKANINCKRSQVFEEDLNFKYIGNRNVADIMQGSVMNDQLDLHLHTGLDSIRNETGADIIIVYFPQQWAVPYGTLGFAGDQNLAGKDGPDLGKAYTALDITTSLKYKVFAHEAGHLIGADHQETEEFYDDFSNHAHELSILTTTGIGFSLKKFHTRMWTDAQSAPQIDNFSNPDIPFGFSKAWSIFTPKTGTEDANNAEILRINGCKASLFVPQVRPFSVVIDGIPVIEYQSYNNHFTALAFDGKIPITYEWYISFDGINYTSLNETDDVLTIIGNYLPPEIFILKVVATDDNNNVAEGFFRVVVLEFGSFLLESPSALGSIIELHPNPGADMIEATININDEELQDYALILFNANGMEVSRKSLGRLEKGEHKFIIDLANINSNFYMVSLQTKKKITDTKSALKMK